MITMIISVFHRRYLNLAPIMEMLRKNDAAPIPQVSDWSQRSSPAVRELCEHLAEVLAEEYVRLLKASAEREAGK